ncbi:MAG: hypothetical protein FJ266_07175 [Planctomycetes bacterium]|nr:hypothetical protein [Planctomycetota bacterium]
MVIEINKNVYNLLEKFNEQCSKIIESGREVINYKDLVNYAKSSIDEIGNVSSEDFLNAENFPEKIKNILCKSFLDSNDAIFFIAGELNPRYYGTLIDIYKTQEEKPLVNIICGPYIAVENDLFLKYYDVYNNKLDNWWYAKAKDKWWEAHPVFKEAHENDKVQINIIRKRWDGHFFLGASDKNVYVEKPHDELESPEGTAFINQEQLIAIGMELWHGIKECFCCEWTKEEPSTLFKPRYAYDKEKSLQKKWDEKYSALYKLVFSGNNLDSSEKYLKPEN